MKPLARLVDLVAAAPTFIERCGLDEDDPTAADQLIGGEGGTQRIFYPAVELDDLDAFPAAVLRVKELQYDQDSGGARNYLASSGVLSLLLVDRGRYQYDLERSGRDFLNFAGMTIHQIARQFAEDENLAGYRMRSFWGPDYDSQATSAGVIDRWMCGIDVHWGG
jgi:hypothetical protein